VLIGTLVLSKELTICQERPIDDEEAPVIVIGSSRQVYSSLNID
jgi:hypothetical protein